MTRRAEVLRSHSASYPDPIVVTTGEQLRLTGRSDLWDGHRWLWAISAGGKEGWVPDDLVVRSSQSCHADRNYSAVELTCTKGERLEVLSQTHGWAWCRNAAGETGWVPISCLAILSP